MNVCVIGGCGYVGLITGLGFARLGHRVVNVDIDAAKVTLLASGQSPIYEEGLEEALRQCLDSGNLHFTTEMAQGVPDAEVVFVAVGSPAQNDGSADLSQVSHVTEQLALALIGYTVMAIKSTMPVGTMELISGVLRTRKVEGRDFDLVVNPEFLREGRGLDDFFHPARIVLGTGSERARGVMRRLYAPFLDGAQAQHAAPVPMSRDVPLLETTIPNAQMVKYAANAFLATRLSFINEVAAVCEQVGADVLEVIKGLSHDPRIGGHYLQAGIGFGGPCLEKDLRALIQFSREHDYEPPFLQAVLERNNQQVRRVLEKLEGLVGPVLDQKRIALFGLAFKPGTNDVRTSLSLRIMTDLLEERAVVCAHDPVAISEGRRLKPQASYFEDPYQAAVDADALLLLTDWPQYRELDYAAIGAHMRARNVVDGWNALDRGRLESLGFRYCGVGR